jgi:hypothetical protein
MKILYLVVYQITPWSKLFCKRNNKKNTLKHENVDTNLMREKLKILMFLIKIATPTNMLYLPKIADSIATMSHSSFYPR